VYRLLLCSEEDVASVNIRDSLIGSVKWEDDGKFLYHNDLAMMTIPDIHIFAENVDQRANDMGLDASEIIFLSRHRAATEIPTLTVHPIGNFNIADFGGKNRTLVKTSPSLMTGLMRSMASKDTRHFRVSFEVTHHGPYVSIPATFIEIGSEITQWSNKHAAKLIADSLLETEGEDNVKVIGIGGGHYAPRFTEIATNFKVDFGHMIPEYAFSHSNEEDIVRMIADAAKESGTKMAYVHKKSMNGDKRKSVMNAINACGLEIIRSADLEISGN
jgi:D-aminoacyl-tRNA deacylase